MLLYNKDLITACSLSRRTYWRRINYLKENKLFVKQTPGDFLSIAEARQIATALGFSQEFEEFLKLKSHERKTN